VFRSLALLSPPHVVWVFTTSRPATFWANVVAAHAHAHAAPASGTSSSPPPPPPPLERVPALRLAPRVSARVMQWAWGALTNAEFGWFGAPRDAALPTALRDWAPEHHAALVHFCALWHRLARHEADATRFCSSLRTASLHQEARGARRGVRAACSRAHAHARALPRRCCATCCPRWRRCLRSSGAACASC
jgi:hypothetical protein